MILKSSLLCIILALSVDAEIPEEDGVLVLTQENFDSALKQYDNLLVEFYAPWCGHCKALEPEYTKAAGLLKEQKSEVKLAKVDATKEKDLSAQYEIRGFPTLKYMRAGQTIDYTGGRTADSIIKWIEKKSGPACIQVDSQDSLDELIASGKIVVAGFFDDQNSDNAKAFEKLASVEDRTYVFITDKSIWKKYDAKDSTVILFKPFDEKQNQFSGDFTEDNLKKFVQLSARQNVVELNDENNSEIFDGPIQQYIVIILDKEKDSELLDMAGEVAKKVKSELMFVHIQSTAEIADGVMSFLGIKKEDLPTFVGFKLAKTLKYLPENKEITKDNLESFVQDFLAGKLKANLKSAELPEDWDANAVKVLVASNFHQVSRDKTKDVLVEFYAPWCGHCKALAPIWDELGEKYKDSDSIVVAKMDGTENELEDVDVDGFPTIKLFKKETNEVVDYVGPRNLESLVKFLETGEQEEDLSLDDEEDFPFDDEDFDYDDEEGSGDDEDEDGEEEEEENPDDVVSGSRDEL